MMLKQVCSVLCATAITLVAVCGCTPKMSEEEINNHKKEIEYIIGEETTTEFINRCKWMIKASYAPESQSEFNHIQSKYNDIATELCLRQLSKSDTRLTGSDFNNTIVFNKVRYGYAKHQQDGIKRVYMNITVGKDNLSWDINIELDVNPELNKVDNIDVW